MSQFDPIKIIHFNIFFITKSNKFIGFYKCKINIMPFHEMKFNQIYTRMSLNKCIVY